MVPLQSRGATGTKQDLRDESRAGAGGSEERVSASERWGELKAGFEPAFWVANFTELFERLAYYAQSAVLAIFLHE